MLPISTIRKRIHKQLLKVIPDALNKAIHKRETKKSRKISLKRTLLIYEPHLVTFC